MKVSRGNFLGKNFGGARYWGWLGVPALCDDDMFSGVGAFLWDGMNGEQRAFIDWAHDFPGLEVDLIEVIPFPVSPGGVIGCWEASLADALTEGHWFPHS